MNISKEQVGALMAGLNRTRVASRSGGGGRQLSYLEAWDVKATLIKVFGFGGFSAETIESKILKWEDDVENKSSKTGGTQHRVTALCTVRLTLHDQPRQLEDGTWLAAGPDVVYAETAISSQSNPDPGEAADFAIKTAESDALKRTATYLGTQFGLSLYNSGQTQDVVQVLLDPTQKGLLEEYRAERSAAQEQERARLQQAVDRSTTTEGASSE